MRILVWAAILVALVGAQDVLQPEQVGDYNAESMLQEGEIPSDNMEQPPMEPPLVQSQEQIPSLAQMSTSTFSQEPPSASAPAAQPTAEDAAAAAASQLEPEDQKLKDALDQVKSDLFAKGKQVKTEAVWIQSVEKIITQYHQKVANVHKNIQSEKVSMTEMLQKKRQIQNLMIQRSLEKQLNSAESSLNELTSQMRAIQKKNKEATENKSSMEENISKIKESLMQLRGEKSEGSGAGSADSPMKDDQELAKLAKAEKEKLDSLIQEKTQL